jgi:hypothetical protein
LRSSGADAVRVMRIKQRSIRMGIPSSTRGARDQNTPSGRSRRPPTPRPPPRPNTAPDSSEPRRPAHTEQSGHRGVATPKTGQPIGSPARTRGRLRPRDLRKVRP